MYRTYKLKVSLVVVSVDAGKIFKTPKTETKNSVNHSTANSISFMFALAPLVP